MSSAELIKKKRDGGELTDAEIGGFIEAFMAGDVADYQMTAFCMAVFLRGMTPRETVALTLAMRDSGSVMNLSKVRGTKVDKHSTGGVGDKVSICLAPLVAACGVPVPMVSGRGLGHTGGTLDKLEAIPGFSVNQSPKVFAAQIAKIGCSLIGQTDDIAPADKRVYALRDVTGTVESIPLITASILSKKLAEGIDALVLDVKVGKGAFMKNDEDATALARSIIGVAKLAGKKVTAVLTDMDAPLGHAIGNALETREAIEMLHGRGPDDLRECTMVLAEHMLAFANPKEKTVAARKRLEEAIATGAALRKLEAIIKAQGGDPRVVEEPDRLPKAPHMLLVRSEASGYINTIDPMAFGLAALELGAGRKRAEDTVDHRVGFVLRIQRGSRILRGDPMLEVHAADRTAAQKHAAAIVKAITVSKSPPKPVKLVRKVIN